MGKGKAWDAAERRVLAVAYAYATHNDTQGADQKNEVYLGTLMTNIRRLAPGDLTLVNTFGRFPSWKIPQ
jgi:hypothetical protein